MPTYIVKQTFTQEDDNELQRERLIEAKTRGVAIQFVASETITAELAETADIVRLAKAGVELEKAE
jgi:hypothetical protein